MKKEKNLRKGITSILVAALLVMSVLAVSANGGVTPSNVEATLSPGESLEVEKIVDVPERPPKIDIFLLEDETGSFCDDIATLQALAPAIWDEVKAECPDLRMGVGGFRDYPYCSWGSPGDWAYRLIQDLTDDKTTFVNGVNSLTCGGGADAPESQYTALYQAATGAGLNVCPDYVIPPGQNPSFRDEAFKVIILTTDAPFHNPTDSGCDACPHYPPPSFDETVTALNDANITVIGIKAPGATTQVDDIAAATDGSVETTGASGAEIKEAIMAALGALTYDVTAQAEGLDPLVVTFVPAVHEDVTGPTTVTFMERIEVPIETAPGEYSGVVKFKANGGVIAEQTVKITVSRWHEINKELDALIEKVNAADMPNIIKNRLIDKLEYAKELKDNAKEECEAGNFDAATKKLGVAKSQVESFASMVRITRRISPADKESFLADAAEIIAKIDELIEYIETEHKC